MNRRLRLGALAVVVVLSLTACRVQTQVDVRVEENGSGTVTVRVGFDDDALRRQPNLAQELKTDDLKAAGWALTGPTKGSDGLTDFTATKAFADPDEANRILSEVSGANGPLRDFAITRSRSFARTKFTFAGTVDLSGGLASFSDSELAAELDGKPLGDDVQAIEAQLGQPLDAVFQFQIAVQLPGDVATNAPIRAGNVAIWQPQLAQPAPMTLAAVSTSTRWQTVIATGVAVLAGLALLVLVAVRTSSALRRRHRHP